MHALRILEFAAVVERLVGHAETSLGAELTAATEPSFDVEIVWRRQTKLREAWHVLATGLPSLAGIADTRDQLKIAAKEGVLDGAVLAAIGRGLRVMRQAKIALSSRTADAPTLAALANQLPHLDRLESILDRSLDGDGEVRSEASPDLAAARAKVASLGQRLQERIQSYVSGRTRELLSDPLFTVRDGRYVIPLKVENRGKVKGVVHDTSASGQTIYVEPEDVLALGNQLREAEGAERAEVARILRDLSSRVGSESESIIAGIESAAELDVTFAAARLGAETGGCLPDRLPEPGIQLDDARHPLLPAATAIPLSLRLDGEIEAILITGPNTGGKTVAIKSVGLAVAMAQAGMMPIARQMRLGCFSNIWADIGDEQSLQQSLSTFSGHIKNIAEALKNCRPGDLVLLDEVGAGTDPGEGSALARALLLAFQARGTKVMASTHYGELKVFAANQPGFVNAAMEFDLKSLRPTYRLMMGTPGSSHAFRIAERYGIPDDVIQQAQEGRSDTDLDIARMIEKLEAAQKQAQRAQSEADRLTNQLRKVESEADAKLQRAEEIRVQVRQRAAEELSEVLRQIRLEAADIFEELKRDSLAKGLDRARQRLQALQEVGSSFVNEMRPAPAPTKSQPAQVTKGQTVRIAGLSQTGLVVDPPKGDQVLVQVGALKMTVKLNQLEVVQAPATTPKSKSAGQQRDKAEKTTSEIVVIQMRAEEAEETVQKFLDDAVLAGMASVRIVHGKGEGILRKVTREVLRRHRSVASFRDGEPAEGGQGATIAVLE